MLLLAREVTKKIENYIPVAEEPQVFGRLKMAFIIPSGNVIKLRN
jgi:hypothetical protein